MSIYIYFCTIPYGRDLSEYLNHFKDDNLDIKIYDSKDNKKWLIFIADDQLEKAKSLTRDICIEEMQIGTVYNSKYLESYSEWANKMYVPGYYTGQQIPYFLWNNKKSKKYLGILLFLTSICTFLVGFADSRWGYLIISIISLLCGITLSVHIVKKKK